eukprot:85019_1
MHTQVLPVFEYTIRSKSNELKQIVIFDDYYQNMYVRLKDMGTKTTRQRVQERGTKRYKWTVYEFKNGSKPNVGCISCLEMRRPGIDTTDSFFNRIPDILDAIDNRRLTQRVYRTRSDLMTLYANISSIDDDDFKASDIPPLSPLKPRTLTIETKQMQYNQSFNAHHESFKREVLNGEELDYVLSKVIFEKDAMKDHKIRVELRNHLLANYDCFETIFPKWPIVRSNYNKAKSVIIMAKIKMKPANRNLNILINDGKCLNQETVVLKVSNEGDHEIQNLFYLADVPGTPTIYPPSVFKVISDGDIVATLFAMDVFNCDLTTFASLCSEMEPHLKYPLILTPIFYAMTIAQSCEQLNLIHTDFKPKNIYLRIDFNQKDGTVCGIRDVVLGDWGLALFQTAARQRTGYHDKIVVSDVYSPPLNANGVRDVKGFLSFQAAMSMIDLIDYTKLYRIKEVLMSDTQRKCGMIINELFDGDGSELNVEIARTLVQSAVAKADERVSTIEFLLSPLWYKSLNTAEEYVHKTPHRDCLLNQMIKYKVLSSSVSDY